jgi:hypothetical protein
MHDVGALNEIPVVDDEGPLNVPGSAASVGHDDPAAGTGHFDAVDPRGCVMDHRSTRSVDFANAAVGAFDDIAAIAGVDDSGPRGTSAVATGVIAKLTATARVALAGGASAPLGADALAGGTPVPLGAHALAGGASAPLAASLRASALAGGASAPLAASLRAGALTGGASAPLVAYALDGGSSAPLIAAWLTAARRYRT